MATLLDAPKGPNPAKVEEFVEKQLQAARRRVRVLDFFLTGLVLGIGTLVFLLAVQLIDRYVETPPWAGWAVAAAYVGLAAGFVYLLLFRPSRRQINPYYAAHNVERAVPNAKNSLVTYVDFEEDARLPGSIKTAISQKAYRDIKGVDLNRAIENRKILWLGIAAGVLLLGNAVVAFLPPTRTELTLQAPKDGDITVFSNQEVSFQVRVNGRIPGATAPDAVRLRMWYNPDDPGSYEDRPMKASDGDRREFGLIVPAKHVRTGFKYRLLAGNAQTPEYTVTAKILPEFRDFEVTYTYPDYLKMPAEKTNDANVQGPFGTKVDLVVVTTREVKQGYMQVEGQERTLDGQLVEGRPDAIRFTFPLQKDGTYQVFFTTTDGDKNTDPTKFRIMVFDAKPVFRTFDLAYDYPAYLRFKPMKVLDVREPQIEAPRGTKLVVTAQTNRPVKAGTIEVPGHDPIPGEVLPDQPLAVRFRLPELTKDGVARVSFTPATAETAVAAKSIPIHLVIDQAPRVRIDEPGAVVVERPKTGTLDLQGLVTDDHGVDRVTLRMVLKGSENRDLVSKPYRNGMSFLRKEDNSWPTRLEYKDFIKIPDLRLEKDPTWRAEPGMEIEYWVEAFDNCAVPGPNRGESRPPVKTLKIVAPPPPPEQKKIDQQNEKLENEQKDHERNQDRKNRDENRDPKQEPPKGGEPQQGDPKDGTPDQTQQGTPKEGTPKDGTPKEGSPQKGAPDAKGTETPMGTEPPKGTEAPKGSDAKGTEAKGTETNPGMPPTAPDHEKRTQQVEDLLKKDRKAADPSQGTDAKQPSEPKPEPGPMPGQVDPKSGERVPKADTPMPKGNDPGKEATPKEGPMDPKSEPGKAPKEGPKSDGKVEPKSADAGSKTDTPAKSGGKDKGEPSKDPAKGGPQDQKTEPGAGTPEKGPMPKTVDPKTGPGDPKTDPGGTSEPKGADQTGTGPKKDGTGGTTSKSPGKEGDPGSGTQTTPQGMKGENDPGEPKTGPGSPPPGEKSKPGELDREMGRQLDREINSNKPEVDPNTKSDVERLMRNPETREQTRNELDKLEKNAKDQLSRQKAQDLRQAGEKAARDYDREKPNSENVDQLAKKLNSKDEKERRDAEQRAKDWEKNPETRDQLKEEVDQLKKKDRSAGEKVENAMNKAEQARKEGPKSDQVAKKETPGKEGAAPKVDEKALKDAADKLASTDPKTRQEGRDQLEQMMQDPKTREQAKEMLDKMAKGATTDDEKRKLENAAKEADQLAKKDNPGKAPDQVAKKEPGQGGDPKSKDDPSKGPDQVAKKEPGKGGDPKGSDKIDPKDLEKMAKDLAGNDPNAKADAEKKMEEMLKDPKSREQAMEQMKEMAKNASSEDVKKALQEMMKKGNEAAKNDPKKLDPRDLQDLAKKLDGMNEKEKQDLARKFEEAMKDPELQDEMKKQADQVAKNGTPEQKKELNDLLKQLNGGQFPDFGGKPDPADPKNRLKSAELTLDDFKKRLAEADFKKKLQEAGWTEVDIDRWMKDQQATIDALRQQALKGEWRDPRIAKSPLKGGPEKVTVDGKAGGDLSRGSQYAPPPGYQDPYKQFTIDAAKGKK
ncbi:MAG TPA: hypothetical protein VM597_26320 [Gemmataceae bacterium]|nr:hypothetical protein [Gemmataceae bacterium]